MRAIACHGCYVGEIGIELRRVQGVGRTPTTSVSDWPESDSDLIPTNASAKELRECARKYQAQPSAIENEICLKELLLSASGGTQV